MTISANSVESGKCYKTATDQVRRVLNVSGDSVTYEARGHTLVQGIWGPRIKVSLDKFVADVVAEVACDFDPDLAPKKN